MDWQRITKGQRWQVLARRGWRLSYEFLRYFLRRCFNDRITIVAGHLTYVSSLALVPLIAVMFSGFAAFPMFDDLRGDIQELVLQNLVPTSGDVIRDYLNRFASNASQMTAVGVVFLVVVAIMLLSTIDKTINLIWRNRKKRRLPIAIAVYWMLLTLGPVLMGSGIAASSYVISLTAMADDYVPGVREIMISLLPFISSVLAFLLLYVLIPNRVVKLKHAIWGALTAALLFELGKRGFAEYITRFPSYEAIYGTLATIPILLVWMYLSWTIVLVGAELTASIEEFREKFSENHKKSDTDND